MVPKPRRTSPAESIPPTEMPGTTSVMIAGAKHDFTTVEIFESIARQFQIFDDKGRPVSDPETGGPLLDDRFYIFLESIIDDYLEMTIGEVEDRLEADQYVSERSRQRDKDLLVAVQVVDRDVNDSDAVLTTEELSAMRKDGEREFHLHICAFTDKELNSILDGLRATGAISTEWPVDMAAPNNTVSSFKHAVAESIADAINSDSAASATMLDLECQFLADPSPATIQGRLVAYGEFIQKCDHTGVTLLHRLVSKLLSDGWAT
jgi:hypothetical protein